MNDKILWEISREYEETTSLGTRKAIFYALTHGTRKYQVMLGITEEGKFELLEHHLHDGSISRIYPYKLLPYMKQRNEKGEGLLQFSDFQELVVFVERKIMEWEASQH